MSFEETKGRLLAASETAENLLALVNGLYVQEIRSEEKTLTDALSELHNTGKIDFVGIVKGIDKNSYEYNFFKILRVFESVLPLLDARVEDILHCLTCLTQQAGRDLAIGGVYEAFRHFCRVDESRSRNSVEFILTQSKLSLYVPFLSGSILAYGSDRMAEAIQATENLIVNSNKMVRNQAYFSLGRLGIDETQANVIWELLSGSATSEHDSDCRASILGAILHFGETFPIYWPQIEELLVMFVEAASTEVLYAISDIVAFQNIDLPESVLHLLVKQLANVSPEQKGIIDNIDDLLVILVERNLSSLAIELLESILAVGVEFTSLSYFATELRSKHQELRDHIITKWFLYGESFLCRGVFDLLKDVTAKDIELKADILLLGDEVKQTFVSRKAVGWLFNRPIAAASFILSIYDIASTTTREDLELILYDPLFLSYPGALNRFYRSCLDKGVQEHLCKSLVGKLEFYHADLDSVSELKELMAPNENIRAYWKYVDRDMQEMHDAASKSSFIQMIATTRRILYGNSSIYYLPQIDGKSVRQEMQMQSFSHSTEMPRLDILDPESLDYILRIYRCERMKNEINS